MVEEEKPFELPKLNHRKRKWKPLTNEFQAYSSTQSPSSSGLNVGSKLLKLGAKEYSLRPFRSNETVPSISITSLPNEVLSHIILHLNAKDIGRLAATCSRFNAVISQSHIWRSLCKNHFPMWNGMLRARAPASQSSAENWKRQYSINHTKGIFYQLLGGASSKRKTPNPALNMSSAFGFKKLCCSRDHVFALDLANCLHVYRWEREVITNEYVYRRVDWHREFAKHVIDVTSDPRYDNNHRRYVYVLTQSEAMRSRRHLPNTRSTTTASSGWDIDGNPIAGDKIDVFDERSCRRVFNMTFDPEMRFVSMKLTTITPHQKTLFILTDAGKASGIVFG
ncbi:unnamed protein product [Clavelina lepadiformis]|uniref:F-box domain-containing protein n=1 Tax=Clavelina lepadiformis TaxID=159417 RepID=A0ABP0H3L3_CLALP